MFRGKKRTHRGGTGKPLNGREGRGRNLRGESPAKRDPAPAKVTRKGAISAGKLLAEERSQRDRYICEQHEESPGGREGSSTKAREASGETSQSIRENHVSAAEGNRGKI